MEEGKGAEASKENERLWGEEKRIMEEGERAKRKGRKRRERTRREGEG